MFHHAAEWVIPLFVSLAATTACQGSSAVFRPGPDAGGAGGSVDDGDAGGAAGQGGDPVGGGEPVGGAAPDCPDAYELMWAAICGCTSCSEGAGACVTVEIDETGTITAVSAGHQGTPTDVVACVADAVEGECVSGPAVPGEVCAVGP